MQVFKLFLKNEFLFQVIELNSLQKQDEAKLDNLEGLGIREFVCIILKKCIENSCSRSFRSVELLRWGDEQDRTGEEDQDMPPPWGLLDLVGSWNKKIYKHWTRHYPCLEGKSTVHANVNWSTCGSSAILQLFILVLQSYI